MTTYPIIYKMIPTQYAFLVSTDGKVQVHQVNKVSDKQFSNEKEARAFISKLKQII